MDDASAMAICVPDTFCSALGVTGWLGSPIMVPMSCGCACEKGFANETDKS